MSGLTNSKRVLIVAGSLLFGIGMIVAAVAIMVVAVLHPPAPERSREDRLAVFMPAPPKESRLVKEGYNPRSNCFDKCGYLYRTYSYSDQKMLCRSLFEALRAVGHKSIIVDTSVRDATQEQCEDTVAQYVQNKSATSYLDLDVRARMKTENDKYHYTNPSIVATVKVSLKDKTIEYQVSQTNENMKFSL